MSAKRKNPQTSTSQAKQARPNNVKAKQARPNIVNVAEPVLSDQDSTDCTDSEMITSD